MKDENKDGEVDLKDEEVDLEEIYFDQFYGFTSH